jgi:hypothetical protein
MALCIAINVPATHFFEVGKIRKLVERKSKKKNSLEVFFIYSHLPKGE